MLRSRLRVARCSAPLSSSGFEVRRSRGFSLFFELSVSHPNLPRCQDQHSVPFPRPFPRRFRQRPHLDHRAPFCLLATKSGILGAEPQPQIQFIDDTPQLFQLVTSQNRAQKVLAYLGDLVVNGSTIKGQSGEPGLKDEIPIPTFVDPTDETKILDTSQPCTTGWRNIIKEKGPAGFAKAVREYPGVLIMGPSLDLIS